MNRLMFINHKKATILWDEIQDIAKQKDVHIKVISDGEHWSASIDNDSKNFARFIGFVDVNTLLINVKKYLQIKL